MIVELDVPFVDTGVSDLRYLPDAPPLPVLAALDHSDLVPDGHLSLRLLGASHQAVLALPDGAYAETLACVGRDGAALPPARSLTVGRWRFGLRIDVDDASREELSSACREMRRCAAHDDPRRSLYASFPGHPLAATFLRIRPGIAGHHGAPATAPAWLTVHVYPDVGKRVRTRTEIRPVRHRRTDHERPERGGRVAAGVREQL